MMVISQRAGVWIIEYLSRAMEGDFTWVHFSKIIKVRRKTMMSYAESTAPLEETLQVGVRHGQEHP